MTSDIIFLLAQAAEILAVIVGVVVLALLSSIAQTPLARRYPKYLFSRILSLWIFVGLGVSSVAGEIFNLELLTGTVRKIFLLLLSISFLYSLIVYRREVAADARLRGLVV